MNIETTTQIQTQEISTATNTGTTQCLTFKLADEEYGVDIMKVQEIRSWEPVTSIPNTPDFIIGVTNLRGNVVPIIDLRKCFNLDKAEYGASTVVVVVKVSNGDADRTLGLVVDAVSEVYNISEEMVCETPELGSAISTDFVKGLANVDEKMLILLDVDLLVAKGVLENIQDQDTKKKETK